MSPKDHQHPPVFLDSFLSLVEVNLDPSHNVLLDVVPAGSIKYFFVPLLPNYFRELILWLWTFGVVRKLLI